MNHVDLLSGWNSLIGSIEAASGPLLIILGAVGVAIIVIFVLKWAYEKRRGGGGVGGFPWMIVAFGAALAAPKAIIPLLLVILSFIVNFVIDFVGAFV